MSAALNAPPLAGAVPRSSGGDPGPSSGRSDDENSWAAMRRIVDFLPAEDFTGGLEASLLLRAAPRASSLAVRREVLPQEGRRHAFGFVQCFDPTGFAVFTSSQEDDAGDVKRHVFVLDARDLSVARIPKVPPSLPLRLSADGLGVIADPRGAGRHFVIVQFQPEKMELLSYCSRRREWSVRSMDMSPSLRHHVSALRPQFVMCWYTGCLVFVDLLEGLLVVELFSEEVIAPRFLALPVPDGHNDVSDSVSAARSRFLMPVAGSLVYGILHNINDAIAVSTWILLDPFETVNPWKQQLTVPLCDIRTIRASGLGDGSVWLAPGDKPTLGMVSPVNPNVVCFFLRKLCFTVDLETQQVLGSHAFFLPHLGDTAHSSLYAWPWMPPTPSTPSPGVQSQRRSMAYKLKRGLKVAYNWAKQNPDQVVLNCGKAVEQGGMLFLPVQLKPGGIAFGKVIQQAGQGLKHRNEWARLLREDEELEGLRSYEIRHVKTQLEAKTIIDDWVVGGRQSVDFKVVFHEELSEADITTLKRTFEDHHGQILLWDSSPKPVSDLNESSELDESEYLFVAA